jgi:TatD DNase family protein
MAPVPKRGERNKPTYVEYVARKIAEIKEISYEEAALSTMKNACRFYGIEER